MARTMSEPVNKTPARSLQIACFDMCQQIGMEIEARGRSITSYGVHFPATYTQIKQTLAAIRAFTDRADAAIDIAHEDWKKLHGR